MQAFECPCCGNYVSAGDSFCENCGTQLNQSTQQQSIASSHYQQQQSSGWMSDQQQPPEMSLQTRDEAKVAKIEEDQVALSRPILPHEDGVLQCYKCPSCGASMDFGVKFCGTCGAQLSWTVRLLSEIGDSVTSAEVPKLRETSKRSILQWIVLTWGIISLTLMGIAMMPLMGMLNWINIPFAALGVIMSFVTIFAARSRKWPSIVGTVLCLLAVVVSSMKIIFGVGFI